MQSKKVIEHITQWLKNYAIDSKQNGYIIGISGGIDSALTSTLCALTGLDVLIVSLPLRQRKEEYDRAKKHIKDLTSKFNNVKSLDIDLTSVFTQLEISLPLETVSNKLAMANTRSRLRMTTLYALGQNSGLLVAGTGNKIEDFGVVRYHNFRCKIISLTLVIFLSLFLSLVSLLSYGKKLICFSILASFSYKDIS